MDSAIHPSYNRTLKFVGIEFQRDWKLFFSNKWLSPQVTFFHSTLTYLIFLYLCLGSTGSTVRLVNGKTPDEGIIQIRYKNKWATLAHEDRSDQIHPLMNAFVVCRMLNYTKAIEGYIVAIANDHLKSNHTIYWPYELQCKGDEATIQDCQTETRTILVIPIYAVCGNLSRGRDKV